jgi:DNA-binding HxlR family transcriptional regulator
MASKRTYGDACGIARALDTVGERWALMIVRELLLGPKRFTDIRAGLPQLSPDVLTQRLRDLEAAEVVVKRKLPPPAASQVYELTPKGEALEPVLIELGRWGGANATPPEEGMGMSVDSHIVSLRTLFDPARAEGYAARIQLTLGEDRFGVEIVAGEIVAGRGEVPTPNATIDTDPSTLLALLHGHRELAEAESAGDVRVEGDHAAVERFLTLFPLPAPAAAA